MIFSFTFWNNCLSIACSIAWSSPEKWAILCQKSKAQAHYFGSQETLLAAHARPHPAPGYVQRRCPGNCGKHFGVSPRLPLRPSGTHVTLLWGSGVPRGPAFGTRSDWSSVQQKSRCPLVIAKNIAPDDSERSAGRPDVSTTYDVSTSAWFPRWVGVLLELLEVA